MDLKGLKFDASFLIHTYCQIGMLPQDGSIIYIYMSQARKTGSETKRRHSELLV